MNKILEITLLYDFYGELLTQRQKTVMEMYHLNDYSLQEVGEELGITRQSVHNMLKRTEAILADYEAKLGLVNRFVIQKQKLDKAVKCFDDIISDNGLEDSKAVGEFRDMLTDILD